MVQVLHDQEERPIGGEAFDETQHGLHHAASDLVRGVEAWGRELQAECREALTQAWRHRRDVMGRPIHDPSDLLIRQSPEDALESLDQRRKGFLRRGCTCRAAHHRHVARVTDPVHELVEQ